jgi:hypothetical protein
MVSSCQQGPPIAARRVQGADRVTAFPARPTIPARPAAYIRDPHVAGADNPEMTAHRNMVISLAQNELGWPVPAVYADAGGPHRALRRGP